MFCLLSFSWSAQATDWSLPRAGARRTPALPCSHPELPATGTALAHLWAVTYSVPSDKTPFPALPVHSLFPQQVSASVGYPQVLSFLAIITPLAPPMVPLASEFPRMAQAGHMGQPLGSTTKPPNMSAWQGPGLCVATLSLKPAHCSQSITTG